METKARYTLIGLFTLAVIVAGFAFVYWLEGVGGLRERALYRVRFETTVSGLNTGSGVFFNGIRVGEVRGLRLDPAHPKQVEAVIAVAPDTPIRADTRAAIDFQGLTGVATVTLTGGSASAPFLEPLAGEPPLLTADKDAGGTMTQAARDTLQRLDKILAENAEPLHNAIANLDTFSGALARNSDRIDDVIAGLQRMTGGAAGKAPAVVYELAVPGVFPPLPAPPRGQLVVADPTVMFEFDTNKILAAPEDGKAVDFGNAQWSDTLAKLFQAKVVQSFENAGYLRQVSRPVDGLAADYTLLTDIRMFHISPSPERQAKVEFMAKILTADGRVIAARLFQATASLQAMDALSATAALGEAFGKAVTELVLWTAETTAKPS